MSGCSKINSITNRLDKDFKGYLKKCHEDVNEYSIVYDLKFPYNVNKVYNPTSLFLRCNEEMCNVEIESVLPKTAENTQKLLEGFRVKCGLVETHLHEGNFTRKAKFEHIETERHEHLICNGGLEPIVDALEKLGNYTKEKWSK